MPSEKLFAKITISSILLISILVIAMSCKECPTEPEYDIYLSVENVACVWVTLNVTLPDSGKINTFTLERNDSTVATYTCFDDDTMITDEGLTPDTDYYYTIRFLKNNQTKAESDPVSIRTLSTTSNDFFWEIDTLGHYGSYLKDAWIVDENNIWVVGNIETDSGTFNAAMWDGTNWNLIQVHNLAPLYSIWYFSDDNIWVSSGFPKHWDGSQWTMYHLQNMGLGAEVSTEYIWASSPNDIYFVGQKGSIVHYNGSTFRKLETGTDVNLNDIDGTPDGSHIYSVGHNSILPSKSIALELVNGQVDQFYYTDGLYQEGTYGYVGSVSVEDHFVYFSTPAGIWQYDFTNNTSVIMYIDEIECRRLFVEEYNDIIGYRGGMGFIHFNGEDWRKERYLENNIFSCNGGDYKDGLAVMVGYTTYGYEAIIARGHR